MGFQMGKEYDHIDVLERFLWLSVKARPEEHKNQRNKTKTKTQVRRLLKNSEL